MKSNRQRRQEIVAKRRTRRLIGMTQSSPLSSIPTKIPVGALRADPDQLVHDNTYGPRPRFYTNRAFSCIDCGTREVWTAAQQKWWYEVAKGKVASTANRCHDCRRRRRLRSAQDRRVHVEGLIQKFGLDRAAKRLGMTLETLAQMRARWLRE
ncbi:MAG: zinc-ribbon domain containing protein [Vicinamibacterales bacterium]